MIAIDIQTADIPETYRRFAEVVGEAFWEKRATAISQEIAGKPFLKEYLARENAICFQLEYLRMLAQQYGSVPASEIHNRAIYPAAGFAAQVLSLLDASSEAFAEQFRRRVQGALKNPDNLRGLRLELAMATHFLRRGYRVNWPEMTETGRFDLLVEDLGPHGLEVECKSFSPDTGRKVPRLVALEFFGMLWPRLEGTTRGLRTGLAVVLTAPGRFPTHEDTLRALAAEVGRHIFSGQDGTLDDGTLLRITEFDAARLGHIPISTNPDERRSAIDGVTETQNRESLVLGTTAGGAIALIVQSVKDDTFMPSVFDTLSTSARRQLTGDRAAMLLAELHGMQGEQLLSIAGQDQDPQQPPTTIALGITKFLTGPPRDHVVGVGFLSEGALRPVENGVVTSDGAAYYFPKRDSRFWSETFSGLFTWSRGAQ